MWRYVSVLREDEYTTDSESQEEESEYEETESDFEVVTRTLEGWEALPDIILEEVLSLLTPKFRHQSSMVCRRWHNYFYSSKVWEKFTLLDRSFTRKKFNLYLGYQYESDPRKVQLCLSRVGSFFKSIIIPPIKDYFNLYEFLRILGYFLCYFDNYPMPNLHTFHFTFHCEFWDHSGLSIHGTGGDILDKTKKVIRSVKNLRELRLSNLMLEIKEATTLMDPLYSSSGDSLQLLTITNCTCKPFPFLQVSQFSALQKLIISSSNIDDETILLFGGTQITEIQIVQDHLTPACIPISLEAWRFLKEMIPYIRVVLRSTGRRRDDMMQQPGAPVYSVIYENPRSQLKPAVTIHLIDLYRTHLEVFAQLNLPRVHGSRSFSERADTNFVMMAKNCLNLHTLIIKERLSTTSILLIVNDAKNLKKLYVRRNAVLKKYDWPRSLDWSNHFYRWIKRTSYDWESFVAHVSGVLGYHWYPLTDKQFKLLTLM